VPPATNPQQVQAQDIDQVLAALAGIVAQARSAGSALGYFPALYRQVTLQVRAAIAQGLFDDGPRMARLDTAFANRYLAAHAAFRAGSAGAATLSRCWSFAFTAVQSDHLIILQNLLLGINAHINFDLPIATAETVPGDAISGVQGDFDRINRILGGLLPAVERVIGRFSPTLGLLDQVGGRSEEEVLNFSLDAAREDSWLQALTLARLPQAAWEPALRSRDRQVTVLARLIAEPGGFGGRAVELIRLTESLDVRAIIDALDDLP
jgi:hypothetical protein